MSLLAPWLVFPLVLGLLSLGLGLLVEGIAGTRLAGTLLLPLGFAALIVISTLLTASRATASLAVPAVAAAAGTGLALELLVPSRSRRVGWWAVGAAGAVFLAYGAPVLLSGSATFAGYYKLDDTATWLALADRVLHGRSTAGLALSSYQAIVAYYLHIGYPLGSLTPLAVGGRLSRVDLAWAYQPYLAFQGALLALALNAVLRPLVRVPWRRAGIAFVAAQPALLYGYALWGSVKEVVAVPLLALLAVTAPALARREGGLRGLLPLGVAGAALLAVLNFGGAVWLVWAVLACLALAVVRRLPLRLLVVRTAALAGTAAVLAIPAVLSAHDFLNTARRQLTGEATPANLIHPLSVLQVAGIWPTGDFRFTPGHAPLAYALIAIAGIAAAFGAWAALRRRAVELPLYAAVSLVGCAILAAYGSPWADAKVYATTSPVIVLVGLAGLSLLADRGLPDIAAGVAVLIIGGVLWSNVLGVQDAWLAPHDQLAELEQIGSRFAGEGPTLVNEYQLYGVRHFLRALDPEASGAYRVRPLLLRDGTSVQKLGYADIDELTMPSLLVYRTLVLPRSPVASRPPAVYQPVWAGRYYVVFQRPAAAEGPIEHVPLGSTYDAVAVPSCSQVLQVAQVAAHAGGVVAYVARRPVVTVSLGLRPPSSGRLSVSVPAAGTYRIWLDGSFGGRMEVLVDGRSLGALRDRIEHAGQLVPFGSMRLAAGRHEVTLRYSGADWHPGSGASLGGLSALVLGQTTEDVPVREIPPSRARTLCGRSLDWLEALGPV